MKFHSATTFYAFCSKHFLFLPCTIIWHPSMLLNACSAHCICCAVFIFSRNFLQLKLEIVIGKEHVLPRNTCHEWLLCYGFQCGGENILPGWVLRSRYKDKRSDLFLHGQVALQSNSGGLWWSRLLVLVLVQEECTVSTVSIGLSALAP